MEALKTSQHIVMFCGHWPSTNGDIKYVISHVTSQNNVIEGSSSLMIGSFSRYETTLPSLLAIGVVMVDISRF